MYYNILFQCVFNERTEKKTLCIEIVNKFLSIMRMHEFNIAFNSDEKFKVTVNVCQQPQHLINSVVKL